MIDMTYLQDKPIAVLGGGAVGKTCAADCKLAGREVRLYSRSEKSIANLERTGILLDGVQRNLYGFERSGKAFLDVVSTDMAKVVKGAGLIVIGIPAHAHEHYLKTLVPLLEDGQVIHVFTDNYASLLLRKYMREMGCDKKVIIGGWGSAPFGTRIEKVGGFWMPHVGAKYRAITLRGACLPMSDIDEFMGVQYGKLGRSLWKRSRYLFYVFTRSLSVHCQGTVPVLSGGKEYCRCHWSFCSRIFI